MSKLIYIINGPNLNLLGHRQPEVYGDRTLDDVVKECESRAKELGLTLKFMQSNREYEIIDWIQEARATAAGIIINPAAYSHTSVAILDALITFDGPVLEVHISNIHQRESFRHHSFVTQRAEGIIAGFGTDGYRFSVERMAALI